VALVGLAKQAAEPPVAKPAVLPSEYGTLVAEMIAGNYGYSLVQAVPLIGAEVCAMCETQKQAMDFVRRFVRLYDKWPGMKEFRWAFCAMGNKPLDALPPPEWSEHYPDGLPEAAGGRVAPRLEPVRDPRSRELPPGEAGEIVRGLVGRKAL
jgi:hypothetical protein